MKLDFLDSYSIRARISPSIIFLAPIAITLFFCFEELNSLTSSTVIICILLSFSNYVPIMQRHLNRKNNSYTNYAAQYLELKDNTFDSITKNRYYTRLASLDPSFNMFNNPSESKDFTTCCESAVIYLRCNTRTNHLVLEENINYGFCKNMNLIKPFGITLCIIMLLVSVLHAFLSTDSISLITINNWLSIAFNLLLLLFWILGIKKDMTEEAAKRYAETLIKAIDSL